jgi:hypothetical protein
VGEKRAREAGIFVGCLPRGPNNANTHSVGVVHDALLAASTVTGRDGITAHGLTPTSCSARSTGPAPCARDSTDRRNKC